jgi:hypothetical protein
MGAQELERSNPAAVKSSLIVRNDHAEPPLAPNLQDQISLEVREMLSRQAQEERQAQVFGQHVNREINLSEKDTYSRALTLPGGGTGARNTSFVDDFDTHVGKPSDPSALVSRQLFFQQRQERAFDRAADSIYPGFGRVEFKLLGQNMRLDYLNGRKCGFKKLGLCLSAVEF